MSEIRDVRTLLLIKNNGEDKIFSIDKKQLYMTVGNYNYMTVYQTKNYAEKILNAQKSEGESILNDFYNEKKSIIKKGLCDNSIFFHPLHVVTWDTEEGIENFWKLNMQFFVVTFLYDITKDHLKSIKAKLAEISSTYKLYSSMNMSDYVIFWKSGNFGKLLEEIAYISRNSNTYTHTICGFNCDFLEYIESPDNLNNYLNQYKCDDVLSMVKITATVRDYIKSKTCLKDITGTFGSKKYSLGIAFGDNDFNLLYKDVNTIDLLVFMNKLKNNNFFNDAFVNLKIRVHCHYEDYDVYKLYLQSGDDSRILFLNSALNQLNKYLDYDDCFYHFFEIICMLKDMCKNPALRRIIYFVVDSIEVFCRSLRYLKNNYDNDFNATIFRSKKNINKYINGVGVLINQLVRIDGYLSQEPGYSPLIYNMIPASLLEYYYSCIYKIIDEVMNKSTLDVSNRNYRFAMLLIPTMSRNIKIDKVIDLCPSTETPVFPPNQLYVVEIPYSMLYKPEEMLCQVTHEIIHFCGESIRDRNSRYKAMVSFVAEAFVADLKLVCKDNRTSDLVYEYLSKNIPMQYGRYLDRLVDCLKREINFMYADTALKNTLCNICVDNFVDNGDSENYEYALLRHVNRASQEKTVLSLLKDISYLFRECQADLTTIYLLNINPGKYIEIIFNEIKKTPDKEKIRMALFVQRIAILFYIMQKDKQYGTPLEWSVNYGEITSNIEDEQKLRKVDSDIKKLLGALASREGNENYDSKEEGFYFSTRCLLCVTDYLSKCYIEIKKLKCSATVIQSYYSMVTENGKTLFNNSYFEKIDLYEKRADKIMKDFVHEFNA